MDFLIKAFFISTPNLQEALNKWTGRHITEEREQKTQKNEKMLSLHKSLASFLIKKTYLGPSLWFTLFCEPHKPTELLQILTVTHTHRMQKASP